MLAPDGEERLTRSGRGPHHVSRDFQEIAKIADNYRAKGDLSDSRLPDFNSFKLALNIASADQRVLVLVAGSEKLTKTTKDSLKAIAWGDEMIGRFHYDSAEDSDSWKSTIKGTAKSGDGIYLIKPDTFGLEGEVLKFLPLGSKPEAIKKAMAEANQKFAATTEKKVYSSHVSEGRRSGKEIEMAMEYGEDRDGDGEIDHRGGAGRRR